MTSYFCSLKQKNFYIISLCPVPNIFILLYYIISVKILVESFSVAGCQNIWVYILLSLLHIFATNIYLVSQLFSDSLTIISNKYCYQVVVQVIIYILLYISVILGPYILTENSLCHSNYGTLYTLAIVNLVLEAVILVSINGYLIYLCYNTNIYRINPEIDIVYGKYLF